MFQWEIKIMRNRFSETLKRLLMQGNFFLHSICCETERKNKSFQCSSSHSFPSLNEFVISFFLEIASSDMLHLGYWMESPSVGFTLFLSFSLSTPSPFLHFQAHAIDEYKFCITFQCENILEDWNSITNFKSIYLTFLMFKWIRLKSMERFSYKFIFSEKETSEWRRLNKKYVFLFILCKLC